MTTTPPPPPPPPPAPSGFPAWGMYAAGGAIALVAAGFGLGWFGGDADPSAASNGTAPLVTFADGTTTVAPGTTSGETVTTATTSTSSSTTSTSTSTTSTSTTTTSTTTTTTIPPLLEDDFAGSTTALPQFGVEYMEIQFTGDDQLKIIGHSTETVSNPVLPVMYPNPYPDVRISFRFNPQPVSSQTKFGAVVLADDPTDGLATYVMIYVDDADNEVQVKRWAGDWFDVVQTPIPPAADWGINKWNRMRLVVVGSTVTVYLNNEFIVEWTGDIAGTPAWWGPMIVPDDTFEAMLVDDVVVVGLDG